MAFEAQLMTASRDRVLRFLAAVISELTLAGRYAYGEVDAEQRLVAVNEAIHRVAGQLRDFCDPTVALTDSRAQGISEVLDFLGPEICARILDHSPLTH